MDANPDDPLGAMPLPKVIILVLLVGFAAWFAAVWILDLKRRGKTRMPSPYQLLVGFVTDFFDALGVGSFATTTSLFRFGNSVDDAKIPGTLNVGHTLPSIMQALIFITAIDIDLWTLWLLIASSVLGAYAGATFVTRLPKRAIQIGMGVALLAAAMLILTRLRGVADGESIGLRGGSLAIGMIGNFVFGALMTIGVGAYAPIMVMVSLLGMNQKMAFPLMMGSCAFLMPVASYRFVKSGKYDARAALGLTLAGIPGVAVAAWIVKEMDVKTLNVLVIFVVIYTALSMLYAATKTAPTDGLADPT